MSLRSPVPQQTGDALIAVDVQNDGLASGSRAAPAGAAAVLAIKHYIEAFAACRQRGMRQPGARALRYEDVLP